MQNFKPIKRFALEISGPLACFTNPISKVERTSYPVPTAGALEYIIGRIYWHPCIRYRIDKINVLNPIEYESFYINERPTMGNIDLSTGKVALQKSSLPLQRMLTCLKNVRYVINFTMFYDKNYYRRHNKPVLHNENANKHIDQLTRRIERGQSHGLPFLGQSEYAADFAPAPVQFTPCPHANAVYYSLYKVVHIDDSTSKPAFTNVHLKNGVVDFSGSKVYIDNEEYTQDEFLNVEWENN